MTLKQKIDEVKHEYPDAVKMHLEPEGKARYLQGFEHGSEKTIELLSQSGDEFREFWIQLGSFSYVIVGSENENPEWKHKAEKYIQIEALLASNAKLALAESINEVIQKRKDELLEECVLKDKKLALAEEKIRELEVRCHKKDIQLGEMHEEYAQLEQQNQKLKSEVENGRY